MCTLSWTRSARGYEVYFNRDESRARAAEAPPREALAGGVRFLAPRDTEAGGTWIAANEWGLTLALLNDYRPGQGAPRATYSSRGELVLSLAGATSIAAVEESLTELALAAFRPFVLFAIDAANGERAFAWNGAELAVEHRPRAPFASSAVQHDAAREARTQAFAAAVSAPARGEELEAFHRSHAPERGALSPCMHRADACTRSLVHVRWTGAELHLAHEPGAPCERHAASRHTLVAAARPAARGR